jgi:hypothetical protein
MVLKSVNDLADDIQFKLKKSVKSFVAYSITIDESTHVKDIKQLAVLIQGDNESFELMEELSELVSMKRKTGTNDLFLKFELLWEKMVNNHSQIYRYKK